VKRRDCVHVLDAVDRDCSSFFSILPTDVLNMLRLFMGEFLNVITQNSFFAMSRLR